MIEWRQRKTKTVQHKNNDYLSKWPNKRIRKVSGNAAGENFRGMREERFLDQKGTLRAPGKTDT